MVGRRRLAFALLGPLLAAGCTGFAADDEAETTALAKRALADAAANAWFQGATLVGVLGEEARGGALPDPEVGNGRATAWRFAYVSPLAPKAWIVRVEATDLAFVEETDRHFEDLPLLRWEVDSDEALGAARANDTFEHAFGGRRVEVVYTLRIEDGIGTWVVATGSESGAAIAYVDGRTGLLRRVTAGAPELGDGWGLQPASAPFVRIRDNGTLTGGASVTYPLPVPRQGQTGAIELVVTKEMPTDGLRWAILDPAGKAVQQGALRDATAPKRQEAREDFALGSTGDHALVLTHDQQLDVPGSVAYELEIIVGAFGGLPGLTTRG